MFKFLEKIRAINAYLIFTIYCLTISGYSDSLVANTSESSDYSFQQLQNDDINSSHLLNIFQRESSNIHFSNYSKLNPNNLEIASYSLFIKSEKMIAEEFSRYSISSSNNLYKIRITCLFYPFHYFW